MACGSGEAVLGRPQPSDICLSHPRGSVCVCIVPSHSKCDLSSAEQYSVPEHLPEIEQAHEDQLGCACCESGAELFDQWPCPVGDERGVSEVAFPNQESQQEAAR